MACDSHGHLASAAPVPSSTSRPPSRATPSAPQAVERAHEGRTGIYDVAVHRDSDGALLADLRAVSRELPARLKQVTEAYA